MKKAEATTTIATSSNKSAGTAIVPTTCETICTTTCTTINSTTKRTTSDNTATTATFVMAPNLTAPTKTTKVLNPLTSPQRSVEARSTIKQSFATTVVPSFLAIPTKPTSNPTSTPIPTVSIQSNTFQPRTSSLKPFSPTTTTKTPYFTTILTRNSNSSKKLKNKPLSTTGSQLNEHVVVPPNDSTCVQFSEYYDKVDAAVLLVRVDRTICCPSMTLFLRRLPKVSGTFTLETTVVNKRQWWRNGDFGIWFDGKGKWVIGLVRNVLHQRYSKAFAIGNRQSSCPADIRVWKIRNSRRRVRTQMTCKCCSLLTVRGSLHVQNPKYGIYSIHLQDEATLVYKQIWPTKSYNVNYIYNSEVT